VTGNVPMSVAVGVAVVGEMDNIVVADTFQDSS
jgi:hypothetical protein